jgi:hypothetical protein
MQYIRTKLYIHSYQCISTEGTFPQLLQWKPAFPNAVKFDTSFSYLIISNVPVDVSGLTLMVRNDNERALGGLFLFCLGHKAEDGVGWGGGV